MRMTARVFGVLCAASLVFCAACDNMGESLYRYVGDKTEKHEDSSTVTYDVGTIVEFNGKDYLVVKNTVAGSGNAGENATVKYYPNTRADAYRDQLLAEQGMTEYVVLFDTTTTKTFPTTATYWDDTYIILHDGKKCYRIRYRWETLVNDFANRTATDLRQHYDPTAVVIDNYKAVYGSDLSKKIFDRYAFNYGADGKTVAYTGDIKEIESYKDYAQINGKERNRYSFSDRIQSNARSYKLRNPNLDTETFFFEFRVDFEEDMKTPKSYRLYANGTGTKEGSASSSLYQQVLNITKVTYDSSLDKVRIESPVNVDVEAGFENRFVSVSSEKTVVGGFNVPKTITFSAPFEDSSAPLNAYTKVTFVPEAKNGGVIYVPKTDSTYPYDFIAQFAKDYQTVFTKTGDQAGPGEGSGSEDKPKVTYEVGTIVTRSGKMYLVTKNSESADGSAAPGAVTTDWGTYYQNGSAAAHRGKLLAGCGVTAYVELFDITSKKGDADLADIYIILQDDKKYYTITQSWVKENLPAEGAAAFADMTENGLREQYDPNVVVFYNEEPVFGTDLSKKIWEKYTFAYDDHGRVRFTDDNMTQFDENKAHMRVNEGAQWRAAYSIMTKKEDDGRERKCWRLKDGVCNLTFAYIDHYSDGVYRVACKGEGTVGGDTSDQLYQELITIRKLQYSADASMGEINYSVSITKNGEKKTENYDTFEQNEHNCLEVSDATVTVSGITVPATITFIARYEDTNAPLGKYTKLIFEPQVDGKVVVYKPKTDRDYDYDFVRQFIDDYQSLYAGAFPSL